jgi:F-box protein 11
MQTGEKGFTIFQDRRHIGWGQEWQERIDGALDTSTFFIPILTPLFFASDACRDELEKFLRREETLRRSDLVRPLYYVDAPHLNDPAERASDPVAQLLAQRQRIDWRDLRFEPQTDPRVGKLLADMALQIRDALGRSRSGTGAESAASSAPVPGAPPTVEPPKAKAERPTHLVDRDDEGQFTSIAAAVAAASPGDRILIRPGRYAESLEVNKALEILGDGSLDEVVVVGGIVWRAAEGRLANLTLRQRGEKLCGVSVEQGRLDLEGCDITSEKGTGVAIKDGAFARLSRNRIHDGGGLGVLILGGAGALRRQHSDGRLESDSWQRTRRNTYPQSRRSDGQNQHDQGLLLRHFCHR